MDPIHKLQPQAIIKNDYLSDQLSDILVSIFKNCSFDDLNSLNYCCKNLRRVVSQDLFNQRFNFLTNLRTQKSEFIKYLSRILAKDELDSLPDTYISDRNFRFLISRIPHISYETVVRIIKKHEDSLFFQQPPNSIYVLLDAAIVKLFEIDLTKALSEFDKIDALGFYKKQLFTKNISKILENDKNTKIVYDYLIKARKEEKHCLQEKDVDKILCDLYVESIKNGHVETLKNILTQENLEFAFNNTSLTKQHILSAVESFPGEAATEVILNSNIERDFKDKLLSVIIK